MPGIAVADQSYCLVTGEVLRVPGVRTIGLGQAALFNQCCLVALCGDDALVDVAQTVDNTTRA